MLKGFAITPVVDGRIGIGEIVEQNGKRLPQKLDHIVITKMHQSKGTWGPHPEMDALVQKQVAEQNPHGDKLRSIPVRIMFDKPENSFRAEYTCFDDKGRPVCSGDGEKAKRRTGEGMSDVDCPGADICSFGKQNRCKQFGRLIIGMESSFENDPLVGFMFRTTSFNSIRTISYRLNSFAALTGGKMAGMPCNLVMKAKSTSASYRKPVFYLDLVPSGGLVNATSVAKQFRAAFEKAGLNRDELEDSVSKGLAQSAFFEGGDDGDEVVEEFMSADAESDGADADQTGSGDQHQHGKLPINRGGEDAVRCSPEQEAEIVRMLLESKSELPKLLEWLGKTPETAIADLTEEEAGRSIVVLTAKLTRAATPEAAQAVASSAAQMPSPSESTASSEVKPIVSDNSIPAQPVASVVVVTVDEKVKRTRQSKAVASAAPVASPENHESASVKPQSGSIAAQLASDSFF